MSNPLVSVIIPTYNSWVTIWKCLQTIKEQIYKNIEIIVVDNNSKDDTKKIAEGFTKNVFNKWPERTAQKNFGIEKSKWKYLLLIDWDMSIDKELINDCVIQIKKDKKWAWICIPVVDIWKSFWVNVIAFERSFYKNTNIEAARFLKKELVKKVWLYKDIIFYEEFIVPQEISQLWYNVKLHTNYNIYHNYWDFTFCWNLKKKFYYWKSLDDYKKKVKEIWIKETWEWQMGVINRYLIFLKNKRFYKKPVLAIW
jgi:glycosyltransferase involved in cell wall biosynthesis